MLLGCKIVRSLTGESVPWEGLLVESGLLYRRRGSARDCNFMAVDTTQQQKVLGAGLLARMCAVPSLLQPLARTADRSRSRRLDTSRAATSDRAAVGGIDDGPRIGCLSGPLHALHLLSRFWAAGPLGPSSSSSVSGPIHRFTC